LPDNGILSEILELARYSNDIDQLERLRAGYVNDDNDAVGDSKVNYCVAGMFTFL